MTEDIYISKYRCNDISEFVGNDKAKKATVRYYQQFFKGSKKKAILYQGPPGTGKTTLALLLAKSKSIPYELVNASDLKKDSAIRVGNSLMSRSIYGKVKLTILDECDRLNKRTQATLAKYVKNTKQPIIITANYPDKISKQLKQYCVTVTFNKPNDDEIYKRLSEISDIEESVLRNISADSDTIRSALNTLQIVEISGMMTNGNSSIDSFDKVDLFKDSVLNGVQHRQKMTPDEIVVYLHDSYCDPRIVSDLDIINGRSREVGYDQWRYFFSYFDNVRVRNVCKFPYTWALISKMKGRKNVQEKREVKVRKLTKPEIEEKKVKKLGAFF